MEKNEYVNSIYLIIKASIDNIIRKMKKVKAKKCQKYTLFYKLFLKHMLIEKQCQESML